MSFIWRLIRHVNFIRLSWLSRMICTPPDSHVSTRCADASAFVRQYTWIYVRTRENCFRVLSVRGCTFSIVWSNQTRQNEQSARNSLRLHVNSRLSVTRQGIRLRKRGAITNNASRNFLRDATRTVRLQPAKRDGERVHGGSIGLAGSWQEWF